MPRKTQSRRQRQSQRQSQSQSGGAGEVPQISQETLQQAGKMAQQLLNNMASSQGDSSATQKGGSALQGTELNAVDAAGLKTAVTGGALAGAVAGADAYSTLQGSPIVGGKRRRGKRGGSRQSQSQSRSQSKSQKGGMIPGLMTAVETALVPLGLYLGQKALQSRRSGTRSLGHSFDFSRASRRTRRRR
jgi:hypothetical protein